MCRRDGERAISESLSSNLKKFFDHGKISEETKRLILQHDEDGIRKLASTMANFPTGQGHCRAVDKGGI